MEVQQQFIEMSEELWTKLVFVNAILILEWTEILDFRYAFKYICHLSYHQSSP